jgi:uncharacterized protein
MVAVRAFHVAVLFTVTLAAASRPSPTPQLHLGSAGDRIAFRRWFTFLAESRYYARKPLHEISDGYSLISWATRHALASHDSAWSRTLELPLFPVMPSVSTEVASRSHSSSSDGDPVFVSRDISEAEPGDLFLYRNSHHQAHVMVFIGRSQIIPSPHRWVVYLSEGRVHRVSIDKLKADPSPDWRPDVENPDFRGVWRLDILAAGYSD